MPPLIVLLQVVAQGRDDLDLGTFDPAAFEWALKAGLGPLLYHTSRNNRKIDSFVRQYSTLLGADLTARVLTGVLLDALDEILAASTELTRNITLLKGVSLCRRHYPEPHHRTMGDIDLLVPPELRPKLESLLKDLGYSQQSEYPEEFYTTHHHSMPFFHPEKRVWVELHVSLFSRAATVANDRVFSREHVETQIRASTRRDLPANYLSDELNIVYICSHWAESFNRVRGLIPMLDILYILKNRGATFDWDKALASLEGSVASSHLYLMLSFLERHNLVSVPSEVLQKLSRLQKILNHANRVILYRLLNTYFIKGESFTSIASESNISILWKTLLMPSSPVINLLRVPWHLLFPPTNAQHMNPIFQLHRIRSAMGIDRKSG